MGVKKKKDGSIQKYTHVHNYLQHQRYLYHWFKNYLLPNILFIRLAFACSRSITFCVPTERYLINRTPQNHVIDGSKQGIYLINIVPGTLQIVRDKKIQSLNPQRLQPSGKKDRERDHHDAIPQLS